MRTRTFVVGVLVWSVAVAAAGAVSVRDIVELSRAGLGDEVILALIDIGPVRYDLDTQQVLELTRAGVSDRVILAMLRSERPAPPVVMPAPPVPRSPDAAESDVVRPDSARRTLDRRTDGLVVLPVFPTAVRPPLPPRRFREVEAPPPAPRTSPFGVDLFFSPSLVATPAAPPTAPVYWGWGGERRPDTWDPAPSGKPMRHGR